VSPTASPQLSLNATQARLPVPFPSSVL
jgi:hypothetical protein